MEILEKDRSARLHFPKADSGSLPELLLTLESPQVITCGFSSEIWSEDFIIPVRFYVPNES